MKPGLRVPAQTHTHTHAHTFSTENGTSGGKNPSFSDHCLISSRMMTNPSGSTYSLMESGRAHPGIAQATALALQSCLEEGLIWAPLVPKLFHFRLLQGSVASSYCAIWIHASRRDTALSGMLIRLLRWPI